jgi:hypothetical protein
MLQTQCAPPKPCSGPEVTQVLDTDRFPRLPHTRSSTDSPQPADYACSSILLTQHHASWAADAPSRR